MVFMRKHDFSRPKKEVAQEGFSFTHSPALRGKRSCSIAQASLATQLTDEEVELLCNGLERANLSTAPVTPCSDSTRTPNVGDRVVNIDFKDVHVYCWDLKLDQVATVIEIGYSSCSNSGVSNFNGYFRLQNPDGDDSEWQDCKNYGFLSEVADLLKWKPPFVAHIGAMDWLKIVRELLYIPESLLKDDAVHLAWCIADPDWHGQVSLRTIVGLSYQLRPTGYGSERQQAQLTPSSQATDQAFMLSL
jgi:hypothetical protein